jgi:mannan endo-1,4-beta-mannosidase
MARTLTEDSTGDDVKFLQERLNGRVPTALPPLDVDGWFGPVTLARVQEFQTNAQLFVDGVVGPPTWSALLERSVAETPGLFVLGASLYAGDGTEVVLRGVNKMCVFDGDDEDGAVSFPEIKQTGANTVRIVWAITSDLQAGGPATSTAVLDALISNAKANHLIPMIELHDATGDWTRLNELVAYWTSPAVVSVIQAHEAYLLVNIGNEVGDETVTKPGFVAGYMAAIQSLRAAGIMTPLVIDASDWGKNLAMLNDTADTLTAADPQGNVIFSTHLYWSMSCGADSAFIESNLQAAAARGYPLVVGEFSQYGGYPCSNPGGSICSPAAEVDYQTIIRTCGSLRIGWYAWEWGPGNDFADPLCAVMDMTPDRLFAHLKPGWATEVALTSPYGIKQTSVTPAGI